MALAGKLSAVGRVKVCKKAQRKIYLQILHEILFTKQLQKW